MNELKKIGISLLYIFIPIFIFLFIFTLLNYFSIINYKFLNIIRFILVIISLFIGGIINGKNSISKGWLEGLKLGIIIVIIYMLLSYLVFSVSFNLKHIIYYGIILSSTTLGSILGINKNKKE